MNWDYEILKYKASRWANRAVTVITWVAVAGIVLASGFVAGYALFAPK